MRGDETQDPLGRVELSDLKQSPPRMFGDEKRKQDALTICVLHTAAEFRNNRTTPCFHVHAYAHQIDHPELRGNLTGGYMF